MESKQIFCFVNKANNKLARCTQRGNHVSNYTHDHREINTEFMKGRSFFSSLLCWMKSGVWRLKFLRVGRCRSFNIHSYTHKNVLHHSPTRVLKLYSFSNCIHFDRYLSQYRDQNELRFFSLSFISFVSASYFLCERVCKSRFKRQAGVSSDLKIGAKNKTIRVNWTM